MLALISAVAILAAILMGVFAWKMNTEWCEMNKNWCQLIMKQYAMMQDEHAMFMAMLFESRLLLLRPQRPRLHRQYVPGRDPSMGGSVA